MQGETSVAGPRGQGRGEGGGILGFTKSEKCPAGAVGVWLVEDGGIQPEALEGPHPFNARGAQEHAPDLLTDALAAYSLEFARVVPDGRGRCRVDLEAEPGAEADGAQGPQVILGQAGLGVAD